MDQAAIDEKVMSLVDRHRPELEAIVDAELGRALDAIVVERIAARNGNVPGDEEPPGPWAPVAQILS